MAYLNSVEILAESKSNVGCWDKVLWASVLPSYLKSEKEVQRTILKYVEVAPVLHKVCLTLSFRADKSSGAEHFHRAR